MKPSISPAVWEKKRSQIAKLYKDEEWPLKQVIKQIRTEEFNPSETQLRSRLKKWRVTKPSRQCRKKPQDSPETTVTDPEEPARSTTTTPPSSVDEAHMTTSARSATQPSSPSNDTNWSTFNGWIAASECSQPQLPSSSTAFEEPLKPTPWAFPEIQPPHHRGSTCSNPEQYKLPGIHTISPIHTYHSTTSPINRVPVDSPPLHSPFTESGFPEICFSTLPPPEYEWSMHFGGDINYSDPTTTGGYTTSVEAHARPPKPHVYPLEPKDVSAPDYINHIQVLPVEDDILAYPESQSFLDDLGSIEQHSDVGPWQKSVSGPLGREPAEGVARVSQEKRVRKPRQGPKK